MSGGWWHGGALPRFLGDLIRGEAARLRPGGRRLGALLPETPLDDGEISFDSIELLEIAGAVSEALHLHESGIEDYLLARRRFGEWCKVATISLARFSAALTFRTSGSTGAAKSCPHRLAALEEETVALAALVPPGRMRVLAAVPSHHIYGFLFTILLPQRLGVPVIDIRDHSPAAIPGLARPGDLVIGHPLFWAATLRGGRWPADSAGVTSTALCPPETAAGLAGAGLAALLQVHGASETAGLGWRQEAEAPFTLLPHWRRQGETGVIRAGEADPAALPDTIRWLDERRYRLEGRRDEAVQVGGINVFPARVAKLLAEHPAVAEATVRLMARDEGTRLKAFIVPRPDADRAMLRRELEALARRELAAAECPRAFTFGAALPRTEAGKPADWRLPFEA